MKEAYLRVQVSLLKKQLVEADIVITTVLTPGERAPRVITQDMIEGMQAGSVTVDLAVVAGGNIETTASDDVIVTANGVTCIGYRDLPSRMGAHASSLYSNSISEFVLSIGPFTGTPLHTSNLMHVLGLIRDN